MPHIGLSQQVGQNVGVPPGFDGRFGIFDQNAAGGNNQFGHASHVAAHDPAAASYRFKRTDRDAFRPRGEESNIGAGGQFAQGARQLVLPRMNIRFSATVFHREGA